MALWVTTGAVGVPCVAAVVAYGELSAGALVVVTGAGLILVCAGVLVRSGSGASRVGRSGMPWMAVLLAAGAFEAVTLATDALPTLSDLLDVVLRAPAARGVAAAAWLLLGAWLVTRPARGPVA